MSTATDLNSTEQMDLASQNAVSMMKLDITNNWTGRDELPFELVGERMLEIEALGPNGMEKGPMSVSFGKPVQLDDHVWACVFTMSAMGRNHASPARGVDAIDALQAAFTMVGKQLAGMSMRHKITFGGGDELGFIPPEVSTAPKAAGCPVMSGIGA